MIVALMVEGHKERVFHSKVLIFLNLCKLSSAFHCLYILQKQLLLFVACMSVTRRTLSIILSLTCF